MLACSSKRVPAEGVLGVSARARGFAAYANVVARHWIQNCDTCAKGRGACALASPEQDEKEQRGHGRNATWRLPSRHGCGGAGSRLGSLPEVALMRGAARCAAVRPKACRAGA